MSDAYADDYIRDLHADEDKAFLNSLAEVGRDTPSSDIRGGSGATGTRSSGSVVESQQPSAHLYYTGQMHDDSQFSLQHTPTAPTGGEIDVVVLPCRHLVRCNSRGLDPNDCPTCHMPFTKFVRVLYN